MGRSNVPSAMWIPSRCIYRFQHHTCITLPYAIRWNDCLNLIMNWINGGCYFTLRELREMHQKHHAYKVDFEVL